MARLALPSRRWAAPACKASPLPGTCPARRAPLPQGRARRRSFRAACHNASGRQIRTCGLRRGQRRNSRPGISRRTLSHTIQGRFARKPGKPAVANSISTTIAGTLIHLDCMVLSWSMGARVRRAPLFLRRMIAHGSFAGYAGRSPGRSRMSAAKSGGAYPHR